MDEQRGTGSSAAEDATTEGRSRGSYGRPEETWSSRLVRDAATRAAAMRETWDRSYRTARTADSERELDAQLPAGQLDGLMAELRTTNELLRDLVTELRSRR